MKNIKRMYIITFIMLGLIALNRIAGVVLQNVITGTGMIKNYYTLYTLASISVVFLRELLIVILALTAAFTFVLKLPKSIKSLSICALALTILEPAVTSSIGIFITNLSMKSPSLSVLSLLGVINAIIGVLMYAGILVMCIAGRIILYVYELKNCGKSQI